MVKRNRSIAALLPQEDVLYHCGFEDMVLLLNLIAFLVLTS